MNFDEFFPHQVCINLDKRPDRWERITARFFEHGLHHVIRFPAVDGSQLELPPGWQSSAGAYGCLRSHLAVVEQAREKAKSSVLIFEDDAVPAADFKVKFADYVGQLPADWDMLFFGGLHGEPLIRVAGNVCRVTHSLSTYAYALKHSIYDSFIDLNRQAVRVLDENTRALQKRFNCYCFMPHLAWVEDDHSDVRGERTNLWWLKESLVLFGPEMDEILKDTVAVISYANESPGSLRNLTFTVDYLSHKLPAITLLVLAHGSEPGLLREQLPANCHLEFLGDSGQRHPARSLKRGFERFGSSKNFFLILDSDVFLTREDIIANLIKCREYDVARSFVEIYDLNERDTLRILNGDVRWDYDGRYQPRKKTALYDSCCIATQSGMRILSEWGPSDDQSGDLLLLAAAGRLRVYNSPNLARRLSGG